MKCTRKNNVRVYTMMYSHDGSVHQEEGIRSVFILIYLSR